MKTLKKSLAVTLVVIMLLTCISLNGFAIMDWFALLPSEVAEATDTDGAAAVTANGTCGANLTWKLYDDGLLVIEGTGRMYDYDWEDCYVPWDSYRSSITDVEIKYGVTSIGVFAFDSCSMLTNITIPDSVTSIGGGAFNYCSSLTSITIPNSVTLIDARAFSDCTSLTSITIPNSVTSIGHSAFAYCTSLKSITILNRDCNIYDEPVTIRSNATIFGYEGSTAQAYAEKYSRIFKIYCDHLNTVSCEAVTATCAAVGYTAGILCKDCGDWLEGHKEVKVPHTDNNKDYICEVCAKKTCDIIPGETIKIEIASNQITCLEFTPVASGAYRFYSSSALDTYGYLYGSDMSWLANDDDRGENKNFSISYVLEKGVTYYWGARLFDKEDCGSFNVTLELDEILCKHANASVYQAVDATCTTNGYTAGTYCDDCGIWTDGHEEIISSGHTPLATVVENEVAPKCEVAGSYDNVVYCDLCGEELSRETVPVEALTHSFTTYTETIAPKCGAEGEEIAYCDNRCGATDKRAVDALAHTPLAAVVENRVAPKCEVAGSYDSVVYCDACGEELSRETVTVGALGHTEETVAGKAPTCTETGLTDGTKCSVCGETVKAQTAVSALGHKDANKDYKCDYGCGHEFERPTPDTCTHMCHQSGFNGFIWKLVQFFWKLFKMNPVCECGAAHY